MRKKATSLGNSVLFIGEKRMPSVVLNSNRCPAMMNFWDWPNSFLGVSLCQNRRRKALALRPVLIIGPNQFPILYLMPDVI